MSGEFEQMTRQYWTAWEQALRGTTSTAAPSSTGQVWQEALHAWTDAFAQQPATHDVMARFGQQARQWYAQIQQVAAQFGGQSGRPADMVEAWKMALGGSGVNLFQNLLDSMNGPGMQGMEQWLRGAQPVLDALKGESQAWTNMPAFGFTREHQQRLQALTAAQLEVQQAGKDYQELLVNASQVAFQRFEQRLSKLAAEGQSIDTPRALFDVWVDAAEEAYAEMALSEPYRHAFGRLLNAQTRLRARVQNEVEQFCAQFGMPTRTELDSVHRKMVELERELRRMRDWKDAQVRAVVEPVEPAPPARPKAAKSSGAGNAGGAARAEKSATLKTLKSAPGQKAAARKVTVKKATPRKSTPRPRT